MTEEQEKPKEENPYIGLEEAKQIANEMREANKERKELLEREERFRAQMILAGRSDAGQIPQPPKEETAKEYKDRVMRGE